MADLIDRDLPQAPDIERAVLGAMLVDREAIGSAVEQLAKDSDVFYKPTHSLIYRAITDLYDKNDPVDLLTVAERLKERGQLDTIGGEVTLATIAAETRSSANIVYHCQLLREKAMLRRLILTAGAARENCFDPSADATDIIGALEESILKITTLKGTSEYHAVGDEVGGAYDEIIRRFEATDGLTGVPTGFRRLDRLTRGWQKGDLIILAGRPSMGKTALALELGKNAARLGTSVALFSLEMSTRQLVMRLLCNEGRFNGSPQHGYTPKESDLTRLQDACARLESFPLYIDDTPGLSSLELAAKAKRLKRERNLGLIIVDYLQLMQGTSRESRQQEISSISRSLKILAKTLDIPVLVLSQLSRAVELRGGDHKPLLSDLRESGAIEQDADLVMFIFRASVYGPVPEDTYQINDQNVPAENVAEVIIRKHRNGPIGTILLHWISEQTKFDEFEYASTDEYY